MLTFFRKRQKAFFIAVTGVIGVSFIFFGSGVSLGESEQIPKTALTTTLSGEPLFKEEMEVLASFMGSGHPFGLSLLEEQLLSVQVSQELAEQFFATIKQDLTEIQAKANAFRPYRHPFLPMLAVQELWLQFLPESKKLAYFLQNKQISIDTFNFLSKLYVMTQEVPVEFLRQMLAYQEKKAGVSQDPNLQKADLSLFGFHTPVEWLGPSYMNAASQVVLNVASIERKERGDITLHEARKELLSLLKREIAKEKNNQNIDLDKVLTVQMRRFGVHEKEGIELFRKLLLCQRALERRAQEVVFDPSLLPDRQALEKAEVSSYTLKGSSEIQDLLSFLRYQIYLEMAYMQPNILAPQKPLDEVYRQNPSLVCQEYVLGVQELDLKKAAVEVSLQKMWDVQMSEEGYAALQKKFKELKPAKTPEERIAHLDGLENSLRLDVDRFTREFVVLENRDKFVDVPAKIQTVCVNTKGADLPFRGIKDGAAFVLALEAGEPFEISQDRHHVYRFSVEKKGSEKRLLSFTEANQMGILRRLLDHRLEKGYADIRKKHPALFQEAGGGWKLLSDVKEQVAKILFASSLKKIQQDYVSFYQKEPSKEELESSSFYVKYGLISSLHEARKRVLAGDLSLVEIKSKVVSKEEVDLFSLENGEFSEIMDLSNQLLGFYKVNKKLGIPEVTEDEKIKVLYPLQFEKKQQYLQEVISKIKENNLFYLGEQL